ncbi:MAG: hypothetical protein WB608_22790, partial [Terracidiphilus sp.]
MSKSPSFPKQEPKSVGRAYLEKGLAEQGHSRRCSVEILNAIFEAMIYGLKRGESVEFPFGKLTRARKQFGQWWDHADDWPAHREPYEVKWQFSPEGEEQMRGPLEKGERAYLKAIW